MRFSHKAEFSLYDLDTALCKINAPCALWLIACTGILYDLYCLKQLITLETYRTGIRQNRSLISVHHYDKF